MFQTMLSYLLVEVNDCLLFIHNETESKCNDRILDITKTPREPSRCASRKYATQPQHSAIKSTTPLSNRNTGTCPVTHTFSHWWLVPLKHVLGDIYTINHPWWLVCLITRSGSLVVDPTPTSGSVAMISFIILLRWMRRVVTLHCGRLCRGVD